MRDMSEVRAVCFDLGGVLVEINHTWDGALRDAGRSSEEAPDGYGPLNGFPEFLAYEVGEATEDEYLGALGRFLGGIGREEAKQAHQSILRQPYPGVPQLLARLSGSGVKVGLLSNINAIHWTICLSDDRFAWLRGFDARVASHLAGVRKPATAIYRLFEEQIGASGDEVLYFDDTPRNVIAAGALGWRAVHVNPGKPTAPQLVEALEANGVLEPASRSER